MDALNGIGTPAGARRMPHMTVLLKPASSLCDLRCKYCFYHSLAGQRERASHGMMARDTASAVIRRALDAARSVTFVFQGGEPLLAGLDFFRFFVCEVKAQNRSGVPVQYAIQTNGAGLTEEFAVFAGENRFLAGLSLDGPKDINDAMRLDAAGKSAFRRATDAAALFARHGVEFNILCVVHAGVARHIGQVYGFFRKQGYSYLQFIPCLDPLGEAPFHRKHSLTPELYEGFLLRLFRLWSDDVLSGRFVSIRFFDNLLRAAAGFPPEQCGMQGACPGQIAVEADGSVYPCDFYCVDEWRIGSIADMTVQQLYASPVMRRFIETSVHNDPACRECRWAVLCRGGCRRDRDASLCGAAGSNVYCAALKRFFAEAAPMLPALVRAMQALEMGRGS